MQGVITSISFDLYGCRQVILTPGLDKDGKLRDSNWFDENRVKINLSSRVSEGGSYESLGEDRIMEPPDFLADPVTEKGPEVKPSFSRNPLP
jgi:hypothetical protein